MGNNDRALKIYIHSSKQFPAVVSAIVAAVENRINAACGYVETFTALNWVSGRKRDPTHLVLPPDTYLY